MIVSDFGILFAASVLVMALGSCATVENRCDEQVSDCIARCQRSTPETGPARTSRPPDVILSECEQRCGCRRGDPGAAQPAGRPTPTGAE